jgi:hypothetical protein
LSGSLLELTTQKMAKVNFPMSRCPSAATAATEGGVGTGGAMVYAGATAAGTKIRTKIGIKNKPSVAVGLPRQEVHIYRQTAL